MWPYAAWTRANFWNSAPFTVSFSYICWGLVYLLRVFLGSCGFGGSVVVWGFLVGFLFVFRGVSWFWFCFFNQNWMLPTFNELLWSKLGVLLYIIQNHLWERKGGKKTRPHKKNQTTLWSPKCVKHEIMTLPLIWECKLKLQNVLLSNHTLN